MRDNRFPTVVFMDSEDFRGAKSALYGYMITEEGNMIWDTIPEKPSRTGLFVMVENLPDRVRVSQDFMGSYGLYLYQEDGYFALSNSFFTLAEKLQGRLTFNEDYLGALLYHTYAPLVYEDTLAREIRHLSAESWVEIAKADGSVTVGQFEYVCGTRYVGEAEAMEALDRWYGKWVRFIRKMAEQGYPIEVDLTGGLDSRIVFSMVVNAGVDLNTIRVSSHEKVNLAKDADDYRIASQIAQDYGFKLNRIMAYNNIEAEKFPMRQVYDDVRTFSLGDTICNKYHCVEYQRPRLVLKGLGSNIKAVIKKTPQLNTIDYIYAGLDPIFREMKGSSLKKKLLWDRLFSRVYHYTWEQWKLILQDRKITIQQMAALNQKKVMERMDTRKLIDYMQQGNLLVSPFLDPEVYSFDFIACNADTNSLALLILTRYGGDLVNYPVQGRQINERTLSQVKQLSARFPVELAHYEPFCCDDSEIEAIYIRQKEFGDYLREITERPDFHRRVCRHVRKDIVDAVLRSTTFDIINGHPQKLNALLAVYEIDPLLAGSRDNKMI